MSEELHEYPLPSGKKPRRKKRVLVTVIVATAIAVQGALGLYYFFSHRGTPGTGVVLPDWVEQDLLPLNPNSRPGTPLRKIKGIVVHYVANPGTSAQANRNYFANLSITRETYASSHFIVGLEGEVIQCVPLTEISYCSNNRNQDTLAIEVCHPEADGKFTDASYDSLVRLTAWLCHTFQLHSEDVIRHYDVTGKLCPLYFVDHEDAWLAFRSHVEDAIQALEQSET